MNLPSIMHVVCWLYNTRNDTLDSSLEEFALPIWPVEVSRIREAPQCSVSDKIVGSIREESIPLH